MGVLDTLAAATLARRTVTMVLDGALHAELEAHDFGAALDRDEAAVREATALDDAAQDFENPTRHVDALDHTAHFKAAVEAHEALRDRILASQVTWTLQSLDWRERIALQAEHPPRPGNVGDSVRGYNFEAYLPELIRRSVVSATDGAGDTTPGDKIPSTTWDALLGVAGVPAREATGDEPARKARKAVAGSLNSAQLNELLEAATEVNEKGPTVPTSARSLLESLDSGASSTQPSPGTSPRSGSTAGSRRTSTTSSGGRRPTAKKAAAKKATSARSAGS